jgi:3-methyladenine DNA glycosylase/8-oxoguanine DNA glycosylase
MVARLVETLGTPAPGGLRAFPSPARVAAKGDAFFRDRLRVGYRAQALGELARAAASGALDLARWRSADVATAPLREEILALRGFGPYAADQVLRLAGRFDHPALDSWMRAEWRRLHPRSKLTDAQVLRRYVETCGPLAGLVLWLELTRRWHEPDAAAPAQ